MKSESKRALLQSSVVLDYSIGGDIHEPKACFIFLHGYQETGERILNKVLPILPKNVMGLGICGPYPIPTKTEKGHRIGYSWYFYNPATDQYFIDMNPSIEAVEKLIQKLGLEQTPKVLLGFSQGGYIAPFIAHRLKNVLRVIGMGCEFLADELPKDFKLHVDLVHGAQDDVVTQNSAKESHKKALKLGFDVQFHELPETGHRIDEAMLEKLSQLFGEIK